MRSCIAHPYALLTPLKRETPALNPIAYPYAFLKTLWKSISCCCVGEFLKKLGVALKVPQAMVRSYSFSDNQNPDSYSIPLYCGGDAMDGRPQPYIIKHTPMLPRQSMIRKATTLNRLAYPYDVATRLWTESQSPKSYSIPLPCVTSRLWTEGRNP